MGSEMCIRDRSSSAPMMAVPMPWLRIDSTVIMPMLAAAGFSVQKWEGRGPAA